MKCAANTSAGKRCRCHAMVGTNRCPLHTEGRARAMSQLRRKTFDPSRLTAVPEMKDAADVLQVLGITLTELRDGRIDSKLAAASASVVSVFLRALETFDLSERVAILEKALATSRSDAAPRLQ
jgi:hypothetical protein